MMMMMQLDAMNENFICSFINEIQLENIEFKPQIQNIVMPSVYVLGSQFLLCCANKLHTKLTCISNYYIQNNLFSSPLMFKKNQKPILFIPAVEVIKDLQLEHNNRSTEIEKLKKDINLLKHNIK